MANDFAAVGSALYTRLGTVQYTYAAAGTALTTGSVPLWNALAQQGTIAPYLVFQRVTGLDEYTFTSSGISLDYSIKVVSYRNYPGPEAYPIYAKAHDVLQDAPLAVSGYSLMRCRRRSQFEYRDNDGYLHVGGIYRIDLID